MSGNAKQYTFDSHLDSYNLHEKSATVVHDGNDYLLLEEPNPNSKVVGLAQQRLLKESDMETILKNAVSEGGLLLYNAFNRLEDVKLKREIKSTFFNLLRLCDDCIYGFNSFSQVSKANVLALITGYEFLLKGVPQAAVQQFKTVEQQYHMVKNVANELREKMQSHCNDLIKVIDRIKDSMTDNSEMSSRLVTSCDKVQDNVFSLIGPLGEISQIFKISYFQEYHESLLVVINGTIKAKNEDGSRRVWTNEQFKKDLLKYQSCWVAFEQLCCSYTSVLQAIEKDARNYIYCTQARPQ